MTRAKITGLMHTKINNNTLLTCLSISVLLAINPIASATVSKRASGQGHHVGILQKSLIAVLGEISIRYRIKFNYDPEMVQNLVVNTDDLIITKENLDKALLSLFGQVGLTCEKLNESDYVIFKTKNSIEKPEDKRQSGKIELNTYTASLLSGPSTEALYTSEIKIVADIPVSGKVLAADNGEPLIGVNIAVKGTTLGAVTDIDGNFQLTLPDSAATLVFSYAGYVSQEVAVSGTTTFDIRLVADLEALEEVVVVGYGAQRKSDVTGAVARVNAAELQAFPTQNAVQALQGKAAGVDITSNARPGEVGTIRIRGNRSFAASGDPLYVVDGIPLQSGGIEAFNPNDIESIEVLKDASASAIYGSRAANGVILVTTKKGKAGKTQINYNGSVYFEKINDLIENFDGGEYAEYRRNAYRSYPTTNASRYKTGYATPAEDKRILGADPAAWESIAAGYTWVDKNNLIAQMRPTTAEEQAKWGVSEVPVYDPSKVKTTDWTKNVERIGITQNHNLSFNMGTDRFKGFISGGYLNQTGTNVGQDFTRYNATMNLDISATKWLNVGGSILSSYGIQNYGYAGVGSRDSRTIYDAAKSMLPFAVPYDNTGNFIYYPGGDINIINPINEAKNLINERKTLRVFGSFFAEAKLWQGLKFRTNFGPDFRSYQNGEFQYRESLLRGGGAPTSTNYARSRQEQQVSWTQENLLFYDKIFNDNHKIGVTLLQSSSAQNRETGDQTATALPYNSQLWYNLGSTSRGALDAWGSTYEKRTLLSYMGRVNYTLFDKYLLTVTGRWDGSSVLAPGNKWDFFPSLAIAWKLHNESFIQGMPWISELKPRLSFGTVGQQSVAPYSTLGGLIFTPFVFGSTPANGYVPADPKLGSGDPGIRPNGQQVLQTRPNPELGWEKTQTWNFGLDFGLVRNRVMGSVEYYIANTYDLIMNKPVNAVSGYRSINENIGNTRNTGVEMALTTVNIQTGRFKWSTDFAVSINKNEITELYNGQNNDIQNAWFIGQPISVFYDYNKIGIWQTADDELMKKFNANGSTYRAGDIRVEDLNGDFKIDPNSDRKILGTPFGKWTLGFTNTFNYRNFELSAFVYSRIGQMIQGGLSDMQGRYASRKVDYWNAENPTNDYPRADYGNGGQPVHVSTLNYQNGSFVKVRYINLGYVIPATLSQKVFITNAKVYVQVLNPFLFSKVKFLDPDVVFQNPNANTFQEQFSSGISSRSLVVGLNLAF